MGEKATSKLTANSRKIYIFVILDILSEYLQVTGVP